MDDLKDLIRLYKEFSMERDTIGHITNETRKENEGHLGNTPINLQYVSEYMLFDAPVNVYSDNHIVISDLQVNKPISKK